MSCSEGKELDLGIVQLWCERSFIIRKCQAVAHSLHTVDVRLMGLKGLNILSRAHVPHISLLITALKHTQSTLETCGTTLAHNRVNLRRTMT